MKLAAASAGVLLALLGAKQACAQLAPDAPVAPSSSDSTQGSPALVVIVADEPGDAASLRLERDLQSLGFAVLRLTATPENSSDDSALERSGRGLGAVAAVRLLAAARGGKLWVLEPSTGRSVTRSLPEPAPTSVDPNELALVTVELLRASIMELHPHPRRPTAGGAPPPQAPRSTAARPARLSLAGAVAVDLGLRSLGPSVSSLWAAWLRVGGCFGVRGFAAFPLTSEQQKLAEGTVEVDPLLLGAGVTCSVAQDPWRLSPRGSLGAVAAHLVTRGTAIDPLRSSSGGAWLGGAYGMVGVGLGVAHGVRLNLDATGVLLPTPAVISVNRREVATWGAPAGFISLGIEVLSPL